MDPKRTLRWQVPDCGLEYEYHGSAGEKDGDSFLFVDAVFSLAPTGGDGATLHFGAASLRQTFGGEPMGKTVTIDEGTWADVLLKLGEGHWREHDGPTKIWTALDSVPTIGSMWPDLPGSDNAGSIALWRVPDRNDDPAVGLVEARRGSLELPADSEPGEFEAAERDATVVTLDRWEGDGDGRMAVLTAHDSTVFPGPDGAQGTKVDFEATWKVLAKGGRLLHASVRVTGNLAGTEVTSAHTGEVALVKACGGPTSKIEATTAKRPEN